MSSITAGSAPRRSRTTGFRRLTLTEAKLFGRAPAAIAWSVGFPVIAMIVVASIPAARKPVAALGGVSVVATYLPIIIAFSLVMAGVNLMPATLVGYREKGVLRRLSTTPVAPGALLGAQLVLVACVQIVVTALLVVVGACAGADTPRQLAGFVLAVLLAAAAVDAVGLAVSAVCWTTKAANVVGTVLFFVIMFFSGLWLPRAEMPSWLRHVSDFTPMGSGVQALQSAAAGHWPHWLPLVVLAGYAVGGTVLAARLFRWE